MCCVFVLLGFFTPRIVLFILPATTLAYAIARNELGGLNSLGVIVVLVGVAVDIGLLGGGARQRRSSG